MKLMENVIEMKSYSKPLTITEQLEFNHNRLSQNIIKKTPIVTFNTEPLFFERTINTIQGSFGSHKSRLAGHIASVLIGNNEIIGMKADKNYNVLYCDTERDTEDELPIDMKGILNLSGTANNEFLQYYSFYNIERAKRFEQLELIVKEVKRQIANEHLIITIDVVTDFVTDFNNLSGTNQFIDFSSRLIKNLDCTLFLVIHENPSKDTNKARGHLGTELANKSNTILSIRAEDENSELYKIKTLKQRRAKKLNNIYVRYSDDFKGLMIADSTDIPTESGYKLEMENFIVWLIEFMRDGRSVSQQKIINSGMEEFGVVQRTIENRFRELRSKPILLDDYELKKNKGNKNKNYYKLISKENIFPI